jgi:hypothetical protein
MSQTCFACDGGFTQTWDTVGAGIMFLHRRELDREERFAPAMRLSVRWRRTQTARDKIPNTEQMHLLRVERNELIGNECRSCQLIRSFDGGYPLRKATKEFESDCPRCDWHWRFICSVCGRPRQLNDMTWCEKPEGSSVCPVQAATELFSLGFGIGRTTI